MQFHESLQNLQISGVDKESPAEITGLKAGDCVLEVSSGVFRVQFDYLLLFYIIACVYMRNNNIKL